MCTLSFHKLSDIWNMGDELGWFQNGCGRSWGLSLLSHLQFSDPSQGIWLKTVQIHASLTSTSDSCSSEVLTIPVICMQNTKLSELIQHKITVKMTQNTHQNCWTHKYQLKLSSWIIYLLFWNWMNLIIISQWTQY